MELKHYIEVVRRLRRNTAILEEKINFTLKSIKFFGDIARNTRAFKWVAVRDIYINKLKWLYAIQDDESAGAALFEKANVLNRPNIVIVEELYLAALFDESGLICGATDDVYLEHQQIKELRKKKKLLLCGWMNI